jgi:hypothetical protein
MVSFIRAPAFIVVDNVRLGAARTLGRGGGRAAAPSESTARRRRSEAPRPEIDSNHQFD